MSQRGRLATIGGMVSLVCAAASSALAQGVNTPNPNLPPDTGDYRTADQVHATYHGPALTIVLQNIIHQPIAATAVRIPFGPDEQEQFQSSLTGMISVNGSPFQPFSGSGPVTTRVFNKIGNITGTFNTEMLAMDLSGSSPFGPFLVRESPTLASTGQTTITNIGGGLFHIDSFFDVFTELSIDGGATWIPGDSSTRVTLMPAPASTCLLALAGVAAMRRRRR
ncbi:MAG: hypothetical protein IBJ11_11535 [Phycisphaerales bacterium]|nr:hypothetical protein [Phycisphaerales bacterium]